MDGELWLNLALIVLFVLIGGVFAATEMAIVSLREAQIRQIEAQGPSGQRIGALVRDPNLFLSSVQVGVTVAGFLSSAFGASTVAPRLAPLFEGWGWPAATAEAVALVLLTLVIAYLSLVFGELVPKRLAMLNAVAFTRVLAPPLRWFAIVMRPVISVLSASTDGVLRLFGQKPGPAGAQVTADEIRTLIVTTPAIAEEERTILADVLEADDRRLGEIMRPRPDVEFVRGDQAVGEALDESLARHFSRFPVTGESVDDVIGFVHIRDLMRAARRRPDVRVASIVRPIPMLPATNRVLATLALMREEGQQIALVIDEFGGTDGIVTLEDLLEELVGEIYDEYDVGQDPEDATRGEGGRFEVDGGLILQEFAAVTGEELPEGPYETVAGFIVDRLGRLARVGDRVDADGRRLEVVAADGRRIRRVAVRPLDAPGAGGNGDAPGAGGNGDAPGAGGNGDAPGAGGDAPAGGTGAG
ncbi:hemolysin family protein [Agromyces archimandritae]|uniref:HlyC/CorC family transporter n=1 Tax=Agromyces archimandritae TaxID=2781962 RepID=A0A975FML1_9MICO|nr:hemolysin family protein [Agromyces archimandritae]QTX05220.1 HlyC/CorC family transporter [Agromyces archimandritae]